MVAAKSDDGHFRYLLGQDSGYPAVNFNSWTSSSGSHVDVQGTHKNIIRQIGGASIVLLKNTNNTLPLTNPSTIAVIGSDAAPNSSGPNSTSGGTLSRSLTTDHHLPGCTDRSCDTGILAVGWGSGTADFPYLIDPLSAIKARAPSATVTSSLSDTDTTSAANAAKNKSVALVFISADSGEGYLTVEGNAGDRNDLKAWHSGDAVSSRRKYPLFLISLMQFSLSSS